MASSGKIEIQKFNGQSFELWKLKMEDLLVDKDQWIAVDPGTKTTGVTDEEWKKLDRKAKSTIRLCVSDLVLLNVSGEATTKALWDKLGTLYQSKSLVNKLFLWKKLYNLRMKDGDSMTKHMNAFNTVFDEIVSALLTEEMRRKNMDNENGDALSVRGRSQNRNKNKSSSWRSKSRGRSKSSGKPIKVVCWKCGKEGHFRRECKSKAPDKGKGSDDAPSAKEKTTSDEGGDVYLASSSTHIDHEAWLIDSGASFHFTPHREWFCETMKEVVDLEDGKLWKKAMVDEMASLHKNEAWDLIELPAGRKPIGNKWAFRKKTNAEGKVEKYKAQLVAKG
eukprot:PITA_03121